ncbi:hypothetical protein GCM10009623_06330 [Nocardioides aestuarii]|uniref:Nucleotidyltransferase domain-containing protein n=1 Tax=Nocardioides aestuarii TaxID=252231 RepID=A0ABW4TII0_9ACTN
MEPLGPADFLRWYGGWDPLTPATISQFMAGFDRPWWIVGGWSVEVVSGVARDHEDMDISMLATDATAFRHFLGDRWTAWNVDESWFRPFDERFPDVRPDSQLWIRRDARSPWVLDIPLTPVTDGRWTCKRDPGMVADLDDVTWVAPDGLRYQRPEITLLFKAAQSRPKDRADAEVMLPLLDAAQRAWLRDAVARSADPGHPWVTDLD